MVGGMIGFGVGLVLFSYSPWPVVSALLLLGVGAMNISYNASNNTLLQLAVPDEYRGRVMSTLFMNRGLVPMGTALAGTLAVLIGTQNAVASMAAVIIVLGIGAVFLAPSLRRLR